MALTVLDNVSSLSAQLNLSRTSDLLSSSLEKLSTGLKINSGADGPAALVISEQQRAQIAGLNQALTNTSTAVNLVQTAEGALNEVNSLLDQARSLALSSANTGVLDQNALNANQAELSNILSTIDNISSTTQFGQLKLLDGSGALNYTDGASNVGTYTLGGSAPNLPSGSYTVNSAHGAVTLAAATKTHVNAAAAFTTLTGNGTININGTAIAVSTGDTLNTVIGKINAVSGVTGVTAADAGTTGGTAGHLALYNNNFGSGGQLNVTATTTLSAGGYVAGAEADGSAAGANLAFDLGLGNPDGAGQTSATDVVTVVAGANAAIQLQDPQSGASTVYSGLVTGTGNVVTFSGLTGAAAEFNGLTVTLGQSAANAVTTTAPTAGDTFTVTNNSLVFQIGANAGQTASLSLSSVATTQLGNNAAGASAGVANSFSSLNAINVNTTQAHTQDAVRVIDKAIQDVTNLRGTLGAFQANTLQANSANLQSALQNTTAAESTIRNTDYGTEISNYTALQVQLQAGASVLGNANQLPAIVAQLLQKA